MVIAIVVSNYSGWIKNPTNQKTCKIEEDSLAPAQSSVRERVFKTLN